MIRNMLLLAIVCAAAALEAWPVVPAPTRVVLNNNDGAQLRAGELNRIKLSTGAKSLDSELLRSLTFLSVALQDDKKAPEFPIELKDAAHTDAAAGEIVLAGYMPPRNGQS